VAVPATLLSIAWTDHNDRLAEFRAAQTACEHSLANAVVEEGAAARRAHELAFQEPANDAPASLWAAINAAHIDCVVTPVLNWSGDDRTQFKLITWEAQGAWDFRRHESGEPGVSVEQDMYRHGVDEWNNLLPKVRHLPEPRLLDSFRKLVPFWPD
jgi:hypothetical protein